MNGAALHAEEYLGPTAPPEVAEPSKAPVVIRVQRRRSGQLSLFVSRRAGESRDDAEKRRQKERRKLHRRLAKADGNAIVVIVVPPTRDEDSEEVANVPDCLGRVRFTSEGYGPPRSNFANLEAWLRHLKDLGRKWRMG